MGGAWARVPCVNARRGDHGESACRPHAKPARERVGVFCHACHPARWARAGSIPAPTTKRGTIPALLYIIGVNERRAIPHEVDTHLGGYDNNLLCKIVTSGLFPLRRLGAPYRAGWQAWQNAPREQMGGFGMGSASATAQAVRHDRPAERTQQRQSEPKHPPPRADGAGLDTQVRQLVKQSAVFQRLTPCLL